MFILKLFYILYILECGPIACAIAYQLLFKKECVFDKIVNVREHLLSALQANKLGDFETESRFVSKRIIFDAKF